MNDSCSQCKRKGLAILPVLYATVPRQAATALSKDLPPPSGQFGIGVMDKPLEDSTYILRGLEPGYLYLRYPGHWAGYMVDAAGYPRFYPNLALEDMPADVPAVSAVLRCERQGRTHAGIEAICIEAPDTIGGPVYIAYSRHRWSKAVLARHAKAPAARMQLVARLDGGAFAHAEVASEASLRRVADFVPHAGSHLNRYLPPAADIQDRAGKAESLLKAMRAMSGTLDVPGLVMALHDPVGLLRNLNLQRQMRVAERAVYEGDEAVAWKTLSSQSIVALRARLAGRKKAELVEKTTGRAWSADNNPSHVRRSAELLYRRDAERQLAGNALPMGSRFVPSAPGSAVGHIEVPIDVKVQQAVRNDHARLEAHYDEPARARFVAEHARKLKDLNRRITVADQDYAQWLKAPPAAGRPDLHVLCEHDFGESSHEDAAPYLRAVSIALACGPMTEHSLAWFKATLSEPLTSPRQLLLRGLLGNSKSLLGYLDEDKKDKLYDSIKGWLQAEDLRAGKWLNPALAAYANPLLAAIGVTAFALNKDGSLDKALRDRAVQGARAALALWERVEVAALTMRMTLGDLQQAALAVGFAGRLSGSVQAPGAARLPARLRLPRAVANQTIDAVFWTTEKLDELLARLPKAPADSAQAAASWVETANGWTRGATRAARRQLPPGQARDLAARWLKFGDSVAGNPGGLLAVGVLVLQTAQFTDNLDKVTSLGGQARVDALLGLGDAFVSLLGGGLELAAAVHQARKIAAKKAFDQVRLATFSRLAAGFGAAGSAFNAVQSATVAYRRTMEGDSDAAELHGVAAFGYGIAAFAGAAMFFGAKSVFFGSLLGLGPVGWAILGTAVGVGLTYAALNAEDTDAEKFVARNAHWSTSSRTDPRFAKWHEEAEAFTALWYEVKAELNWGDTLAGSTGLGMDQVTAKITIADSNPAEGWRYRLKVFMPDGREVIVHTATSGSAVLPLPRFVPALQPWPKHLHQPVFVEGPGYLQRHDAAVKREGNALTLEHVIEVNDELFDRALLEFDYFPDAGNPNEKVRLDIRCGDDE